VINCRTLCFKDHFPGGPGLAGTECLHSGFYWS